MRRKRDQVIYSSRVLYALSRIQSSNQIKEILLLYISSSQLAELSVRHSVITTFIIGLQIEQHVVLLPIIIAINTLL